MVWPPQNTGLFAPPDCIMCCVVPCVISFVDNPFLTSLYSMTPRPMEATDGVVVTTTNMTTFTRFSADIVNFTFGFDRYYISNTLAYDPAACGEVFGGTMDMSVRITSRTGGIPINLAFDMLIYQGGNFFINNTSPRTWKRTAISAGFTGTHLSWSATDPWNRFNPSDSSPVSLSRPDFTVAGAPMKFGFRVSYGAFNSSGATNNLTFDIESFGALF